MFIFARCLRSAAALTPAKYELDIIQVTTVFIIRKNWENKGTEIIGLVTHTPELYVYNHMISASGFKIQTCFFWSNQTGP